MCPEQSVSYVSSSSPNGGPFSFWVSAACRQRLWDRYSYAVNDMANPSIYNLIVDPKEEDPGAPVQ